MSYDPDKLAVNDDDLWLEAAERLKMASDAESDNRTRGVEALKFRWGEQWPETARNDRELSERPCLTINHTDVACQRLENQLRQQRPRIKVHPTKDSTVEKARRINGLTRHIETRSNASVAYDSGVAMAKDIGDGYWRITSEYIDYRSFDQELMIKPIFNPFSVYMDPGSVMPAGEDASWCFISEKMKRQQFKRDYPKAENADYQFGEGPGDFSMEWESRDELRLAEYFRKFEVKDTLIRFTDGSIKLESELRQQAKQFGQSEAELAQIFGALGIQHHADRPTTRCQIQWFRLNGRKIVDRRILPGKYIPIVRCMGNRLNINGKTKRKGMIENLIDPARMYNYWDTAFTERLALAPKAPWVAYEGVVEGHPEWIDANRKSYSTLVAKAVTGPNGELLPLPQRQNPAQIESGFVDAMNRAERDLMTVAGTPADDPELRSRIVSGDKHLQRRQGMADLTHFQYYDNQTYSIMMTGIILLDLIPYYYDTARQQRIIGEDGKPEMISINQEGDKDSDMTTGSYDVVMDTGPGYATKREEAAENMMRLVESPLGDVIKATAPDVVFRNMDFHGADEIADRAAVATPGGMDKIMEGLPKQAQNIIGALQQQIQQKDQTIQQQAMEIKYKAGIQQSKNEADDQRNVRDNVTKTHIATIQSNTTLEQQGMKDETAHDVAEINAATQLLNTNTEAAHDRRAARELIDAGTDKSSRN